MFKYEKKKAYALENRKAFLAMDDVLDIIGDLLHSRSIEVQENVIELLRHSREHGFLL